MAKRGIAMIKKALKSIILTQVGLSGKILARLPKTAAVGTLNTLHEAIVSLKIRMKRTNKKSLALSRAFLVIIAHLY